MKRKNMMRRNLSQTIRRSLGRYIAIVAIVALGAGVFSGLRVTKVDMVATVQDYTDRQNMFDLRAMSNYGWSDAQVDALSQAEGISHAEGCITLDALIHFGNHEDQVYKLLSIPESVNRISLEAGRMPQAPNECLADSFFCNESMIGQTVYISPANDADTLENLACDSYTVVGLTGTPLYLNMQRGSTSIGSGSVSSYLYIPMEGFSMDAYTEISLSLDQNYAVYTDEYNDAMDSMAETLEELCTPLAQQRFEEVIADPIQELTDAEAEILDAQAQIADAEAEIAEGEAELADGEAELADGWAQYQDGLTEFQDAKADTLAQLAEAEQALRDVEAELEENRQLLADGMAQIIEAEQTLTDSQAAIDAGWVELATQKNAVYTQLAQAKAELDTNKATVEAALVQVNDGLAQIETAKPLLEDGIAQLESLLEVMPFLEPLLAEQLAEYRAQYEELVAQQQLLIDTKAELEAALIAIEAGYQELEAGQTQADAEFAAAEQQLLDAQAQLDEGRVELESQKAELEKGMAALTEGEQALKEGWQAYYDGRATALRELSNAEQELADAKQELLDAERKLADGRTELEDAKTELADAKAELADGQQEVQDGWAEIEDLEDPEVFVLTRNTNLGYVVFESDSDIVAGVATIFPVFFLAIAALVCITTMTRMIDEERTQIGVLKALGYGSRAIMGKYLGYSASAATLGCVLGVGLGCTLFPTIIWRAYCIMYGFQDKLVLGYDIPTIAFIFISYVGLILLVTWYCCRKELVDVPAELIRPKPPAAGKQVWMENLFFWKKLKFLNKVAIRNIFRYRQRLAMMLLGIGGCTALLVTGFGIGDSISDIVAYQYETVTLYDIGVTFDGSQSPQQQDAFRSEISAVSAEVLFCHQSSVDLEFSHGVKNVYFLAIDADLTGFIDLHSGKSPIAMPGPGEAVVTIGAATAMGIEVGDTVTLRNADMEELIVTISGIYDNNVNNYVVVNAQTIREQWEREPEIQTAFVITPAGQDVHQAGASISEAEGVLSVSVNQDTADTVGSMMSALDAVILLIVICAGLLAGTVLYNLTNINIKERIREIATIKVLGFNGRETASYVFKENLTLTVFGTLLGLVGGKFLHALVMSYVRIDMVWFANRINPISYVIAAVLTLLAAIAVDFIMHFQLEKINMAEALKSVE